MGSDQEHDIYMDNIAQNIRLFFYITTGGLMGCVTVLALTGLDTHAVDSGCKSATPGVPVCSLMSFADFTSTLAMWGLVSALALLVIIVLGIGRRVER